MVTKQTDWPDLINRLSLARKAYDEAASLESHARSQKTDALNRLNGVQKEFDAAAEAERNTAPRDTDWAQRKHVASAA